MSTDKMFKIVEELATDKTKTRKQIEDKIKEYIQTIMEEIKNES